MTNIPNSLPFEEGKYYSRKEANRTLGKNFPGMNWLRWEDPGRYGLKFRVRLTAIKRGGSRWSHVEYEGGELNKFFFARAK